MDDDTEVKGTITNEITDADLERIQQATVNARRRHGIDPDAKWPKPAMERIQEMCELGARISQEAIDRGEPIPCDPPKLPPLCYADVIVPPFARGLRLDDEALRSRVERTEAIEETRKALLEKRSKIVFVGVSGSGKTSLAAAALREFLVGIFPCPTVEWLKARDVALARSRHPFGQGEPPILERGIKANLIVIDDLGQDPTPKSLQSHLLLDVVMERYDALGPTWTTTWLSLAEMSARYGEGFARRILEGARVIQCGHEKLQMTDEVES